MANKCSGLFTNNPAGAGTCVIDCPRQEGFEFQLRNGAPACVNTARPSIHFPLKAVPALDDATHQRKILSPELRQTYIDATEHAQRGFFLAMGQLDKETLLKDAFSALQEAENIRDKSPQAYQDARIRYYTLLKGDDWVEEEKKRVLVSEVGPKVSSYMTSYYDMLRRTNQQRRTMDVVKAVKDKMLSMTDDFKMTTNLFSKQIGELKNQIELEKRKNLDEKEETVSWMHMLVNALLVVFAIAAILVLVRKLTATKSTSAYTPTPGIR